MAFETEQHFSSHWQSPSKKAYALSIFSIVANLACQLTTKILSLFAEHFQFKLFQTTS